MLVIIRGLGWLILGLTKLVIYIYIVSFNTLPQILLAISSPGRQLLSKMLTLLSQQAIFPFLLGSSLTKQVLIRFLPLPSGIILHSNLISLFILNLELFKNKIESLKTKLMPT